MADDVHRLGRFLDAQQSVYEQALAELKAGRKRSHWMWFVFPQLRGLGRSPTAAHFGIGSLAEAQAYLAHPLLGARLREATAAVLGHPQRSLHAIFGSPDDLKFCSCMTLFNRASALSDNHFLSALTAFCGGMEDASTVALLEQDGDEGGKRRLP
jgi:uncharacterized protein (DUF1810 family)